MPVGRFLLNTRKHTKAMHQLTLPYPPSVNTYWRHVGPRVLVSKHGRQYRTEVCKQLRTKRIRPIEGDLIVDITINPPDRRRRDVDNVLKALLDSLQFGGAFEDDSQIVRLTIEKHEPLPKRGKSVEFESKRCRQMLISSMRGPACVADTCLRPKVPTIGFATSAR